MKFCMLIETAMTNFFQSKMTDGRHTGKFIFVHNATTDCSTCVKSAETQTPIAIAAECQKITFR